jgi:hypothetical protein
MNPELLCGCSDNKLDSPFRLNLRSTTTIASNTVFNARINVVDVEVRCPREQALFTAEAA